ncbi:MAG: hypothetical protein DRP85_03175 [Candidatus Makaraimicrobium thalassicum]|nr:MAG: hypothetical protein DRP85_03175 [Candidatus Omnitrophota bacterium]
MTSFTGNHGFIGKESALQVTIELNRRIERINDLEMQIEEQKVLCGDTLIALKKRFRRGYYLPWIKQNVNASVSTCNKYVRLTKEDEDEQN